jgi:hypothetical protein
VEIVRAGDEDVERFAVKVGNDTDKFRRSRYTILRCSIASRANLSENTIKILRSIFANVEFRPLEEFEALD